MHRFFSFAIAVLLAGILSGPGRAADAPKPAAANNPPPGTSVEMPILIAPMVVDGNLLAYSTDTEGDVARVLAKLEGTGQSLKVLRILANSTATFRPFVLLSNGLLNGSPLPAEVREAMILHLASTRGTRYEWEEHVPMSERAGITAAQRAAIAQGDLSPLSDGQRLAISAADEIVGQHSLGGATWQQLVSTWADEGALDVILVTAWWGAFVPTILESLGLHSVDGDD